MKINRKALKANAKSAINGTKPSPVLVCLVALVALYILSLLTSSVTGLSDMYTRYMNAFLGGSTEDEIFNIVQYWMEHVGVLAWLIALALEILTYMCNCGVSIYCLYTARAQQSGFANLLDGFTFFFRLIGLAIVEFIFVFLWSLLFVIPGIIAEYRYRLAFYLLIDHPDWTVMQCIRESKRLMRGRKGELFVLDLSFIGWYILNSIPFVSIWVTPYTGITYAMYYDAVIGADRMAPIEGTYEEQ